MLVFYAPDYLPTKMSDLYCESYGAGTPIVLLHGWSMHSGIWREFAQALATRYRVTCIDLPAHGRSTRGGIAPPATLEGISDAVVNALPDERGCLLGWSLGATVALNIAHRYPEKLNALILLAGNPLFMATDDWAGIQPSVLDSFAENLTANCTATLTRFLALQINGLPDSKMLLKQLKAALNECPPPDSDSLQECLAILKNSDLRPALAQLILPVSVILGDKDTLVPVAVAPQIQQLNSELNLTIINGAGHTPFLSHTIELLALITRFMDAHALR